MTVICKERERLFAEYNRSVAQWANAVQNLSNHAGTRSSDFLLMLAKVDEARAETARAKAVCAAHVA